MTSPAPQEPPTDPLRIPRRLTAPEPGWTTSADVIVVGSGIAGLTCALKLRQQVDRVLLVTKTVLDEGSRRGPRVASPLPSTRRTHRKSTCRTPSSRVSDSVTRRLCASSSPRGPSECANWSRSAPTSIAMTKGRSS